jgi:hypothetical protein
VFDEYGRVLPEKVLRIRREVEKAISIAKFNSGESHLCFNPSIPLICLAVTFDQFDFRLAATQYIRPYPPPEDIITWEDDIPKSGFSKDGEKLIFYLPKSTPQTTVVSFFVIELIT